MVHWATCAHGWEPAIATAATPTVATARTFVFEEEECIGECPEEP